MFENNYGGWGYKAVFKWWVCPKCGEELLFRFNGQPPWPPLDLRCPLCQETSTIPWRVPPLLQWTCSRCGYCQPVGGRSWSRRVFQVVSFSGYNEPNYGWASVDERGPECALCGDMPFGYDGKGAKVSTLRKIALTAALAPFDVIIAAMNAFSGISDDTDTRKKDCINQLRKAEVSFNTFLKTIPSLVAEKNREIAEERQREEEAKEQERRRREQIRREMRTVSGLKRMKPTNFELAVASLYLTLGYKVYVTPISGDKGIDLVVIRDKERIAIQCKRYRRTVPVSQVRDFYGSFVGTYNRGVFITSSAFSQSTLVWVEARQGLDLVDGQQLARLFVEHNPRIVSNVDKWKEHLSDEQ